MKRTSPVTISYQSDQNMDSANRLVSRGAAMLAFAAIFAVTIVYYAGSATPFVTASLLTDGLAAVLWIAAAAGLGALVLRGFRVPLVGALGFATTAGAGLGIFSLVGL